MRFLICLYLTLIIASISQGSDAQSVVGISLDIVINGQQGQIKVVKGMPESNVGQIVIPFTNLSESDLYGVVHLPSWKSGDISLHSTSALPEPEGLKHTLFIDIPSFNTGLASYSSSDSPKTTLARYVDLLKKHHWKIVASSGVMGSTSAIAIKGSKDLRIQAISEHNQTFLFLWLHDN
jgi:hypothetical protein